MRPVLPVHRAGSIVNVASPKARFYLTACLPFVVRRTQGANATVVCVATHHGVSCDFHLWPRVWMDVCQRLPRPRPWGCVHLTRAPSRRHCKQ